MADIRTRLKQAFEHHVGGRLAPAEAAYRAILAEQPAEPDALHLLGVLTHQKGDAAGAEEFIRRAIAAKPDASGFYISLGNVLGELKRLMDASAAYEKGLQLEPGNVLGWLNLGMVLRTLGRVDAAIEKYQRVLALQPNIPEAHAKLGVAYTELDQLDNAARHFRKAVELKPDYIDARASLGNVLRAQGQPEEAAEHFDRVLAAKPDFAEIHFALGMIRKEQERLNDAAECFRRAIANRQDYAEAHDALGDVRTLQGRTDEAFKSYRRALVAKPDYELALKHLAVLEGRGKLFGDPLENYWKAIKENPNSPTAHRNLGVALMNLGKISSAESYLLRAAELSPTFPDALFSLGNLRFVQGRLGEAEQLFRRALELRPDYAEAHGNLGALLTDRGKIDEAFTHFRRALELHPHVAGAHTGLIFALDFNPAVGFKEHQEERRRWFERHGRRYQRARPAHDNPRDPERRLRVGYVSADFRRHSAAYSFGPVLRHHDRSRFEVFAYSSVTAEDDWTELMRGLVDHWRPVAGRSDDETDRMIREDKIDVLVDLSGHSNGNRLLVFARKPAPVQITAWGHCTGTGLPTIDYLFADPVTVPADVRPFFAEKVFDLPCAIAYEAPDYVPAVAPSPLAGGAPITFGSLNRLSKMTNASLNLWARVLLAVPGSRLLLKDRQLQSQGERERILGVLGELGIPAERVLLEGGSAHAAHLAVYGQIDIGLDPFPQNGGISTLEALWMGVPVIARLGNSVPSRIASGILTAAGLADWVAVDDAAYIDIAKRKAADVAGLAALRAGLRQRLSETAVGNPELYARAVEDAYRTMWRRWCAEEKA